MASSESDVPEQLTAFFERFLRHRDLSLFLPFFLGFTDAPPGDSIQSQDNPSQDSPEESGTPRTDATNNRTRERIILINPFTQGMVVIEGGAATSLESILRDLGNKGGQPPASRASIEALPGVVIGDGEEHEGECVICLEDWEVGAEAKVMPCSHKFHPACIEKWLGIHGSCPVCRYMMPVEEEESNKNRDEEETERTRRMEREVWVSFSFRGGRRNDDDQDQEQGSTRPSESNPDASANPEADNSSQTGYN